MLGGGELDKKTLSAFYREGEARVGRVEVWENEKSCENTSRKANIFKRILNYPKLHYISELKYFKTQLQSANSKTLSSKVAKIKVISVISINEEKCLGNQIRVAITE